MRVGPKNSIYDLGVKISDLTSKTKTSLKISDRNLKKIESKVREHFKKPLLLPNGSGSTQISGAQTLVAASGVSTIRK